jgi:hypothetical protein
MPGLVPGIAFWNVIPADLGVKPGKSRDPHIPIINRLWFMDPGPTFGRPG